MEHGNPAYTYNDLSEMKRTDLVRLAKKLKIDNLKGKNDDLIDRIVKKSEEVKTEYDDAGELVAVEGVVNKERVHPVLGKYVKCVVNAREPDVKDNFFANSHYSARIKMGEEIIIPEGFVKFINTACYSIEHYYDESKYNPETGKNGMHTSRQIQDFYAVIV